MNLLKTNIWEQWKCSNNTIIWKKKKTKENLNESIFYLINKEKEI